MPGLQDEIVMGGMVLETNLQEILTAVKEQVWLFTLPEPLTLNPHGGEGAGLALHLT